MRAARGLVAARVVAVERHAGLRADAAARLRRLGYANVEIHRGDGSGGWPPGAPYDAILVAASGPRIPDALRRHIELVAAARAVRQRDGMRGDRQAAVALTSRYPMRTSGRWSPMGGTGTASTFRRRLRKKGDRKKRRSGTCEHASGTVALVMAVELHSAIDS